MKSLNDIMEQFGSDKGNAKHGHNYCVNYEKWFEQLRNLPITLLELGIGGEDTQLGGASLLGWEEYFQNATIAGIDIYDKHELHKGRVSVFQGSQDDENFLKNTVIANIGTPDIIIDDASHINKLTISSFKILFPLLKQGGLYIIEDLQCAYRWDFGGYIELKDMKLDTIMNYLFSMLHDLNPVRFGDSNYVNNPDFKEVKSVHFYLDMVVIKKK